MPLALPAFVTLDDLDERLPGGVGDDVARAQAALEDAAALIRTETGKAYIDAQGALDLPSGDDGWRADALRRVNLSAAIRALANPEGVTQEQIGNYSYQVGNASPDVFLTASEKRAVKRAAGQLGLASVSTTRGPLETPGPRCGSKWATADVYLPVDPPGAAIPFE